MTELIIIPDDELGRLEEGFSCAVRRMAEWNTDGVFGYWSVPISVVENAARESSAELLEAASRLRRSGDRAKLFLGLLRSFGPALIEKITVAYTVSRRSMYPPSQQTNQNIVVDSQA